MVLWLCNGSARQFLIQLSTAWPHLERRRNLEKTWHKINKLRGKKRLIARLIAINLYFMPLKCKVHAEVSTHTVYSRCNELNLINVGLPPAATSHFTVLHKSTFRLTSTFNVNWYVDHFNCWESFRKKIGQPSQTKRRTFFCFVCLFLTVYFNLMQKIPNTRCTYVHVSRAFNQISLIHLIQLSWRWLMDALLLSSASGWRVKTDVCCDS